MTIDFGEDFWVEDDLAEDLRTVTGVLVVEQAIYRRLGTPRGTCPSPVDPPDEKDSDNGYPIESALSLGQLPNGIFAMQAFVAAEVNKEDAVDPAQTIVRMTTTPNGGAAFAITGVSSQGPFSLVVPVATFATTAAGVSFLASGSKQ